jgi:hypothetical protein
LTQWFALGELETPELGNENCDEGDFGPGTGSLRVVLTFFWSLKPVSRVER